MGTEIQVSGALGQHCLHFSHPQTEDSEGAPSLPAQQRVLFKLAEGKAGLEGGRAKFRATLG